MQVHWFAPGKLQDGKHLLFDRWSLGPWVLFPPSLCLFLNVHCDQALPWLQQTAGCPAAMPAVARLLTWRAICLRVIWTHA